jgi:hypothetical protein
MLRISEKERIPKDERAKKTAITRNGLNYCKSMVNAPKMYPIL